MLSRSALCARGITSACPRVAGAMSMNAIVRSSSSTIRRGQLARDDLAEDAVGVGHRRRSYVASRPAPSRAPARARSASACSRVVISPAYCACGELLEQLAEPRARARSRARRRARRRAASGRGGPSRAPAQRVAEQSRARARRCASIASSRAVAARRQPVGDRQQRDVDLDRRAGAQVGEHRPPRQRLRLVHEEAEPQVVAHQRRDVRAQPLAGAQPPEHLARQLRAAHVVADERHAPVARANPARERLGGVVQQRPPAQRLAAASARRRAARRAARRPASRCGRQAASRSSALAAPAAAPVSSIVRSSTSSVWP